MAALSFVNRTLKLIIWVNLVNRTQASRRNY